MKLFKKNYKINITIYIPFLKRDRALIFEIYKYYIVK